MLTRECGNPDQAECCPGGSSGKLNGGGHGSASGQLGLGERKCWLPSGPWLRHTGGVWGKVAGFGLAWGEMVNLEHSYYDKW